MSRLRRSLPLLAAVLGALLAALSSPPASCGQYVVGKGEGLASIAEKHGVSLRELMRANGILDPNRLYAGEVLQVPGKAAKAAKPLNPSPSAVLPGAPAARAAAGAGRRQGPSAAARPHAPAAESPARAAAPVSGTAYASRLPAASSVPTAPSALSEATARGGTTAPAAAAASPAAPRASAEPRTGRRPSASTTSAGVKKPSTASTTATAGKKPSAAPASGTPLFQGLSREPERQQPTSLGRVLVDMVWKLALVLALAYGSLVALRKWSGQRLVGMPAGSAIQHLEALSLGSNRSLHLIRVGERVLLVGAGSEGLRLLCELRPEEAAPRPREEGTPAAFPGILERFLKQSGAAEPPDSGRLSALLGDTARHLQDRSAGLVSHDRQA